MTQRYNITVHTGIWQGLSWEAAKQMAQRLLDFGITFDYGYGIIVADETSQPPKPIVQTVRVFVCSGCSREFNSKTSLQGHLNRGTHRIVIER